MATSQTKELPRPQLFTVMTRYIPGLVLTGVITGLALNVGDMPWFINMGAGGADPGYSLRHYRGKYAVPMATAGLFRWCGLCQTVFTAARDHFVRFPPDLSASG